MLETVSLYISSLIDPPTESPITNSVIWVQGTVQGSVAATVAVIAVATIGLLMLSGRLELRRGITVVIGCFILFGASSIAATLTGMAATKSQIHQKPSANLGRPLMPSHPTPTVHDPYAGASVPMAR